MEELIPILIFVLFGVISSAARRAQKQGGRPQGPQGPQTGQPQAGQRPAAQPPGLPRHQPPVARPVAPPPGRPVRPPSPPVAGGPGPVPPGRPVAPPKPPPLPQPEPYLGYAIEVEADDIRAGVAELGFQPEQLGSVGAQMEVEEVAPGLVSAFDLRQAVIMAEVLGRPRALRRR